MSARPRAKKLTFCRKAQITNGLTSKAPLPGRSPLPPTSSALPNRLCGNMITLPGTVASSAGFVYRGTNFARELTGKYIWPDNVSGRIWAMAIDANTNVLSVDQIATMPSGSVYGGTSSCALDQNGEIYFVKIGGVGAGLLVQNQTRHRFRS